MSIERPGHDGAFPPSLEAEWSRLRNQVEFSRAFWLGFVIVRGDAAALELRRRLADLLAARASHLVVVSPQTPAAVVEEGTRAVLSPSAGAPACIWIDAVRRDTGAGATPWRDAIVSLVQRLNERREAIRRRHQGGLVIAVAPGLVDDVRTHAPDLWSVRQIVLDVVAGAGTVGMDSSVGTAANERDAVVGGTAIDPDILLEAATAPNRTRKDPGTEARLLAQAAIQLADANRFTEADDAARLALSEAARSGEERDAWLAEASYAKAYVDATDADVASARSWIDAAIRHYRAAGINPPARSLDLRSELLIRLGDLAGAKTSYEESLELCRRLVESMGDSPERLRDVSISLNNVGGVRQALGDLAGAKASFEESLALRRRLVETLGDSPERLRDLRWSLRKIAETREGLEPRTHATDIRGEAIALADRICSLDWATDADRAIRNVIVSDVARDTGG